MRNLAVAGGGVVETAPPALLVAITAIVSAVLGALGLWAANRLLGKAAFQTAINDGFAKLTDQLQEERDGYRRSLDEERVKWAAERATLQGEVRNLMQAIESLKSALRRHGIPIPVATAAGHEPDAGAVILGGLEKQHD